VSDPLTDVAELIRRETGIALKREQLPSLEAALGRLQPGMSAAAFLAARVNSPDACALSSRLIDEITVQETFFLRQPGELAAIRWQELLAAARANGSERVRVWVAGCATGEEAYTLAMLASEAFAGTEAPVSILATDISLAALTSARDGRYGSRRVRALDAAARERYFVPDEQQLAVGRPLRALVEFRRHNLVGEEIPPLGSGPFELILCRNVLIYFDGPAIERVIGALERALAPEGMLLLGAADRLCGSSRRLARMDQLPAPGRPVPSARKRQAPQRPLRRPLRREQREAPAGASERVTNPVALEDALRAADKGQLEVAIELTARVLEEDPLNADAYFIRGLAELGLGDADAAALSLRRALYVDPSFGLAAFQLGRAHEARGDRTAATRAYNGALSTLAPADGRHAALLERVDVGDMATVCAIRLRALSSSPGSRSLAVPGSRPGR
jgi:chemotaxis methyl-accepting protein methylase